MRYGSSHLQSRVVQSSVVTCSRSLRKCRLMIKSSECFGAKSKIYAVLAPTRLDHFVCFDSLRIPFERIRQFQDHTSLNKMWTLVRGYADYSSALKLRFHCRLYLHSLQRLRINRMKIDAPLSARLENGSGLTHRRNSSQK